MERPRWPSWSDVALGILAAVMTIAITVNIEPTGDERGIDGLGIAVMLVATLVLAFRRVADRAVLAVVTVCLLVFTARAYVGGPVYLALGVALFTLADLRERREVIVPAALSVGVMVLVGLFVDNGTTSTMWHLFVFPGWAAAAIFLGTARRNRRDYLRGLEERARFLEESKEEEARRRVVEERLRIARDLHDVIAHSIATITLQSGVAAHVLDRQPAAAADALEAIRRTSRDALHELKATLDLLRSDESGAPRAPTPGLSGVESLAESAGRAGLTVTVRRVGDDDVRLSPAADVAGYRIVQESITNVMRHAGTNEAIVTITTTPTDVEIEVIDHGRGAAAGNGTGHGIAGMQERAAIAGGTLAAGPRPGGGYRVKARLPLEVRA